MQITFPGFILIPLGIILLITSRKYLYYFTVFFIPFTGTSLLNSSSGAALNVAHYLILLLFLSELKKIIVTCKIRIPKDLSSRSILYMFIFMGIVSLTLIMPAIINGRLQVYTGEASNFYLHNTQTVRFSFKLLERIYPLVFGILLAYLIAIKSQSPILLRRFLKIYSFSIFFISIWGLFQLFCHFKNITYPDFIFNTMVEDYKMEVNTTYDFANKEFFRINSVTQEPSHLALILLTVLPFFIISLIKRKVIFSIILDRIMFFTILSVLILSTSTAAILGFILLFPIIILVSRINKIFRVRYLLIIFTLCFFVIAFIIISSTTVQDYVSAVLLTKSESSSAFVRAFSIVTSWSYFLQYPILGIGWSLATSHDLIVYILANSGIVGLFSFLLMIFSILSRSIKNNKKLRMKFHLSYHIIEVYLNGLIISFVTYLCVSMFLGFIWYQPIFYFLIGMLIAYNTCIYSISSNDASTTH